MKLEFNPHYFFILALLTLLNISVATSTYSKEENGTIAIIHTSTSMISGDSSKAIPKGLSGEGGSGREMYQMGSTLPDCTHACGVCHPCKRVMVSFRCASESCPVVYRCLCNGKYYHVPSSK